MKTWLKAKPSDILVAEITPSRSKTAQLAEIVGIWGYYYPAWTPQVEPWTVIMLKLKMLWVDVVPNPCAGWISWGKCHKEEKEQEEEQKSPNKEEKQISLKERELSWKEFPAPSKPGRSVFEFFYATYTSSTGKWKMKGQGLYNSALLHPDALACLFQVIRSELQKDPEHCGEGVDLCGDCSTPCC